MCSGAKRKKSAEKSPHENIRASEKRLRRPRDPNSWSSSIPTLRSNILCLGMSYPCVPTVLHKFGLGTDVLLNYPEPSVEQAIELVRRDILNEIDGRDLARVKALEANNDLTVYTVSKELGAKYYLNRHIHFDFNNKSFIKCMKSRWGNTIKFRQVILDYYWSPSGSWAMKHWKRNFFNEVIPDFVYQNMLNYGNLEKDTLYISASGNNFDEDYVTSTAAAVYLPFCENCFVNVISCYDNLSKVFTISFLTKCQLEEHTLWKATNTIPASSMRYWLAKTIDQEELYCKLTRQNIKYGIDSPYVSKKDLLLVYDRLQDAASTRMIKLTALRHFHPEYKRISKSTILTLGLDKGGYVGLKRSVQS